jgi:hypothetical protein
MMISEIDIDIDNDIDNDIDIDDDVSAGVPVEEVLYRDSRFLPNGTTFCAYVEEHQAHKGGGTK